jgi:hypothetical protein
MSDSDKICSKITITRIEKPMNETNFPNNSDLITNKSNFIENNCSNVKEKSDYTEKTDCKYKLFLCIFLNLELYFNKSIFISQELYFP